jgi:Tol biopolymer transport system component
MNSARSASLPSLPFLPLALLAATCALGAGAAAQTPVRLTAGSGPGARHPAVALDADVVVYCAVHNGVRDLYSVATDGTLPTRLTNGAAVRVGHGVLDLWPPFSVSDDGRWVAYWNEQGVHVLDRRSRADVVVATAALLPVPCIAGDGSRVVFQQPVNGDLEVFVVPRDGSAAPVQVTSNSGRGRRQPHLRGGTVLFQKMVGAHMEVFAHDLAASTTTGPLTATSGGGNRNARLLPDGSAFVYEALVADFLTPMRRSLGGGTPTVLAAGGSGARLPAASGDDQVVLQAQATAPEVVLVDPTSASLTSASRGGHRLPAIDRHGRLLVWQREHLGQNEVFALRRCPSPTTSNHGPAGQPSVGVLAPFVRDWRCEHTVGLHTQLPNGTFAVFVIGPLQNVPLAPLGAPGNWSLVAPQTLHPVVVDASGDVAWTFPLTPALQGTRVFGQFALADPTANALGLATSRAFDTTFR